MAGPAAIGKGARECVFIDRDGTLNIEKNYLYRYEDWEWIPGSIDALRDLNSATLLTVVVTNQAGVARGYYDTQAIETLHREVDNELHNAGVHIDAYYYCPHHPQYGIERDCDCRKPLPGMLLRAARDWNIDLRHSWMVGDKLSDMAAGLAAGSRCILVGTGYGLEERSRLPSGVHYVDDFFAASRLILQLRCSKLEE